VSAESRLRKVAWLKRFRGLQCRVATGWEMALPYHAYGKLACSAAPNNKAPRDLISSWPRADSDPGRFLALDLLRRQMLGR
jgi:hypothetical protein